MVSYKKLLLKTNKGLVFEKKVEPTSNSLYNGVSTNPKPKEVGMSNNTTIFRQILSMIPQRQFETEAEKYGYNRYTKHFTVWNQLKVNLYSQISGKMSLRDIETGLKVQYKDWYHLGLKNVSRSQLAYVNQRRSSEIFRHLYYHLFSKCTTMSPNHKFRFKNP